MKVYVDVVEDDEEMKGRRWRNEKKLVVGGSLYDTIDMYDLTVLIYRQNIKGLKLKIY